eukprot:TRINITY_DN2285_c0_g1_i7.p2 TRINITY_DN2285_c0_g1~~TRINITY_DN2285_c0_g1_i7.p2  ORF type:complete len:164 (+),score=23.74 TRINITY_DN2285_c0_g1_i7:69-560(+)
MVFLVSVGTDLYGRKYNAKLEFAERPSLAEFVNAVEAHYDTEARAHRPAGYPDVPYRVETMQVYDDVRAMRWVDLHSAPQLVNGAQTFRVYLAQRRAGHHPGGSAGCDVEDTESLPSPGAGAAGLRLAASAQREAAVCVPRHIGGQGVRAVQRPESCLRPLRH